ncbi:MAG: adenosine deaminase, partial [Aquabacterium sp.]
FDLAGAERGHPPGDHARALRMALDGGLALTLHAGESDAGERVLEAVRLGAARIGHGVRLADLLGTPSWPALSAELAAHGTHLEVCPTSNIHTGAAASLATHPIRALWAAGVSLSVHSDNRLMSLVTPSSEVQAVVAQAGLGWVDLLRMQRLAAQASFLPAAARQQALQRIDGWGRQQGLAPG